MTQPHAEGSEPSGTDLRRPAIESVTYSVFAAVDQALGVPGVGVGLAGLGPPVVAGIEAFLDRSRRNKERNQVVTLASAGDALGYPPERVLELADTPEKQLLAELALEASAATVLKHKVVALGRALADGFSGDDAKLDETTLIVRALADLEVPHVRVLQRFAVGIPEAQGDDDRTLRDVNHHRKAVTRRELDKAFPDYGIGMSSVLAVLMRHGLVEEVPVDIPKFLNEYQRVQNRGPGVQARHPEQLFRVTPFGVKTLDYLTAVAAPESANSVTGDASAAPEARTSPKRS